jgi:hypothetical protein
MRAPHPKSAYPLLPGRVAYLLLLAAGGAALISCEEAKLPTASRGPSEPSAATSPRPNVSSSADLTAQGTIPLPINQSGSTSGFLFALHQLGLGPNGLFSSLNSSSNNPALAAETNGSGTALRATTYGSGIAIRGTSNGSGEAARFQINNTNNGQEALFATTNGTGFALYALTVGPGPAARVEVSNARSSNPALYAQTTGLGYAASFIGIGSLSKGVYIQTSGGAGLQVVGGSKQAVVATAGGARSLYTEESSEVWFTDYGFGRLHRGRTRVLIDPTFAQTVNTEEPYHVFLEEYGQADLYVAERTPLGFVVAVKDGDPDTEFSYRVVAKRRGFESARLEPAPWADASVALSRPDR